MGWEKIRRLTLCLETWSGTNSFFLYDKPRLSVSKLSQLSRLSLTSRVEAPPTSAPGSLNSDAPDSPPQPHHPKVRDRRLHLKGQFAPRRSFTPRRRLPWLFFFFFFPDPCNHLSVEGRELHPADAYSGQLLPTSKNRGKKARIKAHRVSTLLLWCHPSVQETPRSN